LILDIGGIIYTIMSSLKVKKVLIINPYLRILRKNLRVVLRFAIQDEIHRLNTLENLYRSKGLEKSLTPSQWKREKQISKLKDILVCLERSSCITCH